MVKKSKMGGRKKMARRARRAPRRKQVNVNRALSPFAQRYITKLKYSEALTLSALNSYQYVFNLNSLFDPNRTGVGHQPYGFDQLANLYNRYRVIACRYIVNGYSGSVPVRYGTIVSNETPVTITSMSELAENPRAQTRVQVPGGNTTQIRGTAYIPSVVGRNKAQYMADDRFQAQTTASPAELALLSIYGQTLTDVNTDVLVTVTLEYTVEFFDVSPLDQS